MAGGKIVPTIGPDPNQKYKTKSQHVLIGEQIKRRLEESLEDFYWV